MKVTTKMIGDAGEHYVLSQFTLHGFPASKMPDNWEAYDLAVESGNGLLRVSIKTRKETPKWNKGAWFTFDDRKVCDWLVFVFVDMKNQIRCWNIPFNMVLENANVPGANRKDPWMRDISWSKLNREPLKQFEGKWDFILEP